MTVSYTYDDEENFIYTKGSGVLTDQDLEEFATAMAKDSRIKTGVRELVDLRAVESVAAPTQTQRVLKHLNIYKSTRERRSPSSRRASSSSGYPSTSR